MKAEPFAVGRTVSLPWHGPHPDACVEAPPFAVGRTVSRPWHGPHPDACVEAPTRMRACPYSLARRGVGCPKSQP